MMGIDISLLWNCFLLMIAYCGRNIIFLCQFVYREKQGLKKI